MFVPNMPFQTSLKFSSKARAYPCEPTFKLSTQGWAPGLNPKRLRLGWKGLRGTITLAYYKH